VKGLVKKVECFYSDANSCYRYTFDKYFPKEKLIITKAETHLIESSNSSIRDNLARFNRRTKRYTKSIDMLERTLDLFFNIHLIEKARKLFCGVRWIWGTPLFH
jgi:IS1 family transposase